MRILVTGATGKIGRNLIPLLLGRGHDVRALVIPGDRNINSIEKMGIELVEGKLEDISIYSSILKDIKAIYHLGALIPIGVTNNEIFEANIRGTYNILEAVAENKINLKRFIFASSDEVYASLKPRYVPLDEYHPRYPYSMYGLSKVMGEDLCNFYFRENKIATINARITYTIEYSDLLDMNSRPGSLFYVKGRLNSLKKISNHSPEVKKEIKMFEDLYSKYGDSLFISYDKKGRPYEMSICDARDLVQGLLLLLENEKAVGETIGFGPPCSSTFDNVVKYLSEKINLPWIEVKLSSDLPFHFNINIAKAKTLLGYNPQWDIYKMIDNAVEKKI